MSKNLKIILLIFVLCFSSLKAGASICFSLMHVNQVKKGLTEWENLSLSNPTQHNAVAFIYLVHGISDDFSLPRFKSFDKYFDSKFMISTSLISNSKKGTYGQWGVIIEANKSAIIQVFNEDASSSRFSSETIEKMKSDPISLNPTELLNLTSKTTYNEILFHKNESSQIKVTGIFVKTMGENTWLVENNVRKKIEQLAKKLNLPIIEINNFE